MNYEVLQDEIIQRMQPFSIAGMDVVRLPQNNDELKRHIPKKGKLTIIYSGSEYGKTINNDNIAQDEEVYITVFIESSSLYGDLGIYNLVKLVKQALTGFKPSGCKKMQVVKHHTIGTPESSRMEGVWQYQIIFRTTSLHVEDFEEDLSLILTKITYIDVPDGEINIVPPED